MLYGLIISYYYVYAKCLFDVMHVFIGMIKCSNSLYDICSLDTCPFACHVILFLITSPCVSFSLLFSYAINISFLIMSKEEKGLVFFFQK